VVNSLRYLRALPRCRAVKRESSRTRRGEPDITGCLEGIRFEIECKVPGAAPTPLQAKRLRDWEAAGAVTGVSRSLSDTKAIIARVYERLCEHRI